MGHDKEQIRPNCAGSFAKLETAVDGFTEAVREFRKSGSESDQRITAVESSTRSAWKELRNDVIPDLKKIPGEVRREINEVRAEIRDAHEAHKRDCPAYVSAMERAKYRHKSTPPSPHESKRGVFFSAKFLRILFYIAFGLGSILAGIVATLGYAEKTTPAITENTPSPER